MSDPEVRRAARAATLVALPAALIAGVIAFFALRPAAEPADPAAGPSPGATAAVTMTAPALPEADTVICRALVAGLPATVRGLTRRPVTAGSEQNAAYGDPPITLACGVKRPDVAVTDEVFTLSNVCWYASTDGKATTWTTLDRQVPVAVTVPAGYDQPGQWTNEFSGAVLSSIKSAPSPYC